MGVGGRVGSGSGDAFEHALAPRNTTAAATASLFGPTIQRLYPRPPEKIVRMDSEFTIRPPRIEQDVEAATGLTRDWERDEFGYSMVEQDWIRGDWTMPGNDLGKTDALAFAADETLAGGMHLSAREPFTDISAHCIVRPEFEGRGLGTTLLQLSEKRAKEFIADAAVPPETAFIRQWTGRKRDNSRKLLEANGYSDARILINMERDMNESPPPSPATPDAISIRPIVAGFEESAFHAAAEEAFSEHWGFQPQSFEQWRHLMILNNNKWDPSLAIVAADGDEIAGVMLLQAQTSWNPDMGWVDDLAVRKAWRRRGVGLALLHHGMQELTKRGRTKIGLEVDSKNPDGAMGLYAKGSMHEVDRITSLEKRLR